jgi:hypothetical protein
MTNGSDALGYDSALAAQACADRVIDHLGEAFEAVLAVGRALEEAKAEMPHGAWERMFKGHPRAVERPIPFSVRTAQMYMAIARNPVLEKTNHGSLFPTSWRTLYELSKVDRSVLENAIADGASTQRWSARRPRASRRRISSRSPSSGARRAARGPCSARPSGNWAAPPSVLIGSTCSSTGSPDVLATLAPSLRDVFGERAERVRDKLAEALSSTEAATARGQILEFRQGAAIYPLA